MKNIDYFKDKNITIVGLARSGASCADLLQSIGAKVRVTDAQDTDVTRLNAKKLDDKGIMIELGKHTLGFVDKADVLVISPGVSEKSQPVIWARERNIPVISEIEVAFLLCPATIIAITGSNGKTTVTTLIAKMLQTSGKRAFACGNIGEPFCSKLPQMNERDFVALEVSSFQLETIDRFKPKVAVILNFSRNHLDRYAGMQEYLNAKKRIFMNQDKSDYLVLNLKDESVKGLAAKANSCVRFFSEGDGFNSNQSAVIAVGEILGIDKRICFEIFKEFKGIEHRMEYVAQINKVRFVNDSKSTTVDSTIWALKNIVEPVVLITGGRDKGNDYSLILDLVCKKAREVILIGEAKEKMKLAFAGHIPVNEAIGLDDAISMALNKALPGDCILFSPMCSSFDMFLDYEDRGRRFKKAVKSLLVK